VRVVGIERGRLPLRRPLVVFPAAAELELVFPTGETTTHAVRPRTGRIEVVEVQPPAAAAPSVTPAPVPTPTPTPAAPAAPPIAALPPVPAPPESAPAPPVDREVVPPPLEASTRGWWVAGAGAAVAAAAIVLIPVSSGRIESNRTALGMECVDPVVNDRCFAKEGRADEAQVYSDGIATWKAVRTGAWVGAGVGLAAVVAGLVLRLSDGRGVDSRSGPALVIDGTGRNGLLVTWTWRR
jgi:hypothetical protein